jgi:hypothetical protein
MSDDDGRELWRRYADGAAPAAGGAACPDEAALAAWLDGRAGDAAGLSVEAHLASCARCRRSWRPRSRPSPKRASSG